MNKNMKFEVVVRKLGGCASDSFYFESYGVFNTLKEAYKFGDKIASEAYNRGGQLVYFIIPC